MMENGYSGGFAGVNWAGVEIIMAVLCNVSRPRLVAGAMAGILE